MVASARNGAYGDAVARLLAFAGHDGRARVLLQRRRRADGPLPRVGRRGPAWGGAARGRLPRRLHRRPRPRGRAIRCRACSSRSRRRSRASASTSTRGRTSSTSPTRSRRRSRASTPTRPTGTLWARTSAHGDTEDRPLLRSEDGSTLYFASDVAYLLNKFARGFDRAIYVLGADHHGYVARLRRGRARCSASTPIASRCCSTSSCC